MRQRLPDRRQLGPVRRVALQLMRRDHMRFGGAVVVVQHATVERGKQRADRGCHAQLLTRRHHVTQGGRHLAAGRHRFSQRLQRHVGQEYPLDALPRDQRQQRVRIAALRFRGQHQGAADGEGHQHFLERHIEAQRRKLQRARGVPKPWMRHMPRHQMPEHGAAHGHTLGAPAGAGGKQYVDPLTRRLRRKRRHRRRHRFELIAINARRTVGKFVACLRVRDEQSRPRIFQHGRQPDRRIRRIQWQAGAAGQRNRQHQDQRGGVALGHQRDHITALHALCLQCSGQPPCPLQQLGVVD